MTSTHKVVQAAAFVVRDSGPGQLVYRDAPVPSDATNLQQLIDDGFVVEVGEDEVGGHPSDLPPSDDMFGDSADTSSTRRRRTRGGTDVPAPAEQSEQS